MSVDPTELARWNARQTRTRAAYHDNPTALGDLLATPCSRCRFNQHALCHARTRVDGEPIPCGCRADRHPRQETPS
jgi:hypothetical protein